MKKLLILLTILILGCEKETCFECTTTVNITGYGTEVSTSVVCGTYTRGEIKDVENELSISSGGVFATTKCREQ